MHSFSFRILLIGLTAREMVLGIGSPRGLGSGDRDSQQVILVRSSQYSLATKGVH